MHLPFFNLSHFAAQSKVIIRWSITHHESCIISDSKEKTRKRKRTNKKREKGKSSRKRKQVNEEPVFSLILRIGKNSTMVRPNLGRGRRKWPARLGSPLRRVADEEEDEWAEKVQSEPDGSSSAVGIRGTEDGRDFARTYFVDLFPGGRVTAAESDEPTEEEVGEAAVSRRVRLKIRNLTFGLGLLGGDGDGEASDVREMAEVESELRRRLGRPRRRARVIKGGEGKKQNVHPGVKSEVFEVLDRPSDEGPGDDRVAEGLEDDEDDEDNEEKKEKKEEGDVDDGEEEPEEELDDLDGDYGDGEQFDDDEEYAEVDEGPAEPTL